MGRATRKQVKQRKTNTGSVEMIHGRRGPGKAVQDALWFVQQLEQRKPFTVSGPLAKRSLDVLGRIAVNRGYFASDREAFTWIAENVRQLP